MAISLAVKRFYCVVLNLELLKSNFASAGCSQNECSARALLTHNTVHGILFQSYLDVILFHYLMSNGKCSYHLM